MKRKNLKLIDNLNKQTIHFMIYIYCKNNHSPKLRVNRGICNDCLEVEKYSLSKLETCPFGSLKPNCPNCPIHCYSKEMRERVSIIMSYAGPRMIFKHPISAIYHLLNSFRKSE